MHYVCLLIATFFPPVIVALLNRGTFGETIGYSPKTQHTGGEQGFPGWTSDGPVFYHAFDILLVIEISLAAIFTYSLHYTLNRADATDKFASSGTIKISVGGANFSQLSNPGSNVTITISGTGSSIKKYKNPNEPPDTGNLEEIGGTSTQLNPKDKLYIQATGTINTISADVTIKATLNVNSNEQGLGTSLSLTADSTDSSSNGLTGTITPQTTGTRVSISTGSITLGGNALKALQYLTQNAVTLSGDSGFRSSTSITITRTSGNANFKTLDSKVQITISEGGTIKRYNDKGNFAELTTNTRLPEGTKLVLEANGTLTAGTSVKNKPVKLAGTIVVTKEGSLGQSGLDFGGGPNLEGVGGSLNLEDQDGPPKHVNITGSDSKIEIDTAAYETIKKSADTTSSSFIIGSADPRNIDGGDHKAGIAKGTGTNYKYLADEKYFQKYWHLLPPKTTLIQKLLNGHLYLLH